MACDCRTRASLWQSAAERAGAVYGVLGVGGAARLHDAFVLVEGCRSSTTAQAFCFGFEMRGGDESSPPRILGAEGRRRRPVRRREPSSHSKDRHSVYALSVTFPSTPRIPLFYLLFKFVLQTSV